MQSPCHSLTSVRKYSSCPQHDQCIYISSTIIDRASTPHSYNMETQGKRYCRTREHICPIQQDIFTRNPTPELEPHTFHPSCIPKPYPPTRAQHQSIQKVYRSHTTQPINSHIPWLQGQEPSGPVP